MAKRTWEEIENQSKKEKVWRELTTVRMTRQQKEDFIREFNERKIQEEIQRVTRLVTEK